ncbi:MAG TPA: hypothetical protein VNN80_19305 [Polyangiaceae bacterium]|nr:hypothetical protein [Polyangiaceae bacterium]
MGNGIEGSFELDGATPLELALDRATEQYTAALQERRSRRRGHGRAASTAGLVVHTEQSLVPARLSWRGIEVTEEFQEYATRVARGEQLAPYRGQVLARPCAEFPWRAPRAEYTDTEPLPRAHARAQSRAPRVTFGIIGLVSLVMAAVGIGSGTASIDPRDAFGEAQLTAALALRTEPGVDESPSSASARDDRTAIESALERVVPERTSGARRHRAAPAGSSLLGSASGAHATPPSSGAKPSARREHTPLAARDSAAIYGEPERPSALFSESAPF